MKYIPKKKFTARQIQSLEAIKPGHIVKYLSVLRKLSKLGLVTLHDHTGRWVRHFWGGQVRAYYIVDAEPFEIEGIGVFHTKFVSGCFNPFLILSVPTHMNVLY